jgi:hypothetical protein
MGFKDLPGGKNDKSRKIGAFAGESASEKTAKAAGKQQQ